MGAEPRVIRRSLDDEIARLEGFVRRMESRYECSSDFVIEATRCGHMKETAEIARWIESYRTLTSLREARDAGSGTGSATTNTR